MMQSGKHAHTRMDADRQQMTMRLNMPLAAWDCHVHVFDPIRFPYVAGRSYTPGQASLDELRDRHRQWGVANTVLVQPSVYGTDNACLLAALRDLGANGRAVAVVDPDTITDEELADMRAAGVVGMRINLVSIQGPGQADPFRKLAQRLSGSRMFLQVYAPPKRILQHAATLEASDLPVVLDHFAGAHEDTSADDLRAIDQLCRNAPVWVKLSADYRLAGTGTAQRNIAMDLIDRFWSAIPDRLIWGSDWPHTGGGAARQARPVNDIEPFRKVHGLSVPRLLAKAGLDDDALQQVLSVNPLRLFGEAHETTSTPPSGGTEKKGNTR